MQWCWNIGIVATPTPLLQFKQICESAYIDPFNAPADPASYPFDCSSGCRKCVYEQIEGLYRCRGGPVLSYGCPSPSPP